MFNSLVKKYGVLFPLLLLVFIDEMGSGLFFPLLAPIILDPVNGILHTSTSYAMRQLDYGLSLSMFPLMMFISAPILGDLSDQYGRKKVLIISLIGTVFGYFLSALGVITQHFGLLLLGRIVDGFTAGNFPIAQAAIIDVSRPEDKTRNLSLMVFAISLGFIIGPLLGGVLSNEKLVSWFNLSTPLFAAAILGLLNTVLIVFTLKETFVPRVAAAKFKLSKGLTLFVSAFESKSIRYLSFLLLFLLLGWGSYIQYVSLFLYQEYGYEKNQLAMFMVVMACAFALSSTFIIHQLTERFSNQRITFFMFVSSCLGALLTVFSYQPIYAWIGLVPMSMGIAIGHATIMAMFSDQVSDEHQGWVMGVTGAIVSLSILISAVINTALGELNPRLPMLLALMFYAVGLALMIWQRQRSEAIN